MMVPCYKCGRPVESMSRAIRANPKRGFAHRICAKRRGAKKVVRVAIKGVDKAATEARQFKHPKSRVMLDKREILFGLDYKRRVREVEELDGYRCQRVIARLPLDLPGIEAHAIKTCGAPSNGRPHHLVKRSKLRDDRASNLSCRCDNCHRLEHPEHQPRFTTDAERNHRLNQELVNDENAGLDIESREERSGQ
jgi:hypothetical protein